MYKHLERYSIRVSVHRICGCSHLFTVRERDSVHRFRALLAAIALAAGMTAVTSGGVVYEAAPRDPLWSLGGQLLGGHGVVGRVGGGEEV